MKNTLCASACWMALAMAFSASAQTNIDLTGYTLSFSDEFTTLSATTTSPKGTVRWYAGYPPNGPAGVYGFAKDDLSCLSVSNGILSNKLTLKMAMGQAGSFCAGPVGMKNSSGTAMVNVGTLGSQVRTHSSWQWYGWAGMKFTVGASPVTISQLGRYAISTNQQTHEVRIFNVSTGADVARANVNCKDKTGWVYANIVGGNVTLAANTSYYLLTDNYNDSAADYLYNADTTVTAAGGITINESRWGKWHAGALFSVDNTGAGFSQKYGYFSMRAKMPSSGRGSWPSFWLKTLNDVTKTSKKVEEIDILEWYGHNYSDSTQRAYVQQASHNWNGNGTSSTPPDSLNSPHTPMPGGAFPWAGFHIYGFKSDPVYCTWYIDGVQTNRIRTPTDYMTDPFWILTEYNVGGGWALTGLVANSKMEIDWLRVHNLPGTAISTNFVPSGARQNVHGTKLGLGTNKPNGSWIWGAGRATSAPFIPATGETPTPLNVVRLAEEKTALGVTLASTTTYIKSGHFRVSADICINSGTHGGGLGFWSSMPARVDGGSPLVGFTGILVRANGDLQLYQNGAVSGTPQPTSALTMGSYYNLSYVVDTATGKIFQVQFNGIAKTFTTTAFTGAATKYVGVVSNTGAKVSMRNLKVE